MTVTKTWLPSTKNQEKSNRRSVWVVRFSLRKTWAISNSGTTKTVSTSCRLSKRVSSNLLRRLTAWLALKKAQMLTAKKSRQKSLNSTRPWWNAKKRSTLLMSTQNTWSSATSISRPWWSSSSGCLIWRRQSTTSWRIKISSWSASGTTGRTRAFRRYNSQLSSSNCFTRGSHNSKEVRLTYCSQERDWIISPSSVLK